MYRLNPKRAKTENAQSLEHLYFELQCDLGLVDTVGMESIDFVETMGRVWSGIKSVASKLGSLVSRLTIMLRNMVEKTFLRYSSIMMRWEKRIKVHAKDIDEDKFESSVIKIVPKNVLIKRISALSKLHHLLSNIEIVCESAIRPDSDDWRTPEISAAYTAMQSIGFDSNRFNLVGAVSSDYDKSREKATVGELGYSISDLGDVVTRLKSMADFASKGNADMISRKFVDYSDKLTQYESSLETSEDLSPEEIRERKHVLKIKMARLWWISHFIKSSYVVAADIMVDVLKLCKLAERCIVIPE